MPKLKKLKSGALDALDAVKRNAKGLGKKAKSIANSTPGAIKSAFSLSPLDLKKKIAESDAIPFGEDWNIYPDAKTNDFNKSLGIDWKPYTRHKGNEREVAFSIPRALFTDETIERLDQYLIEYEKGKLDGVSSESFFKNARLKNGMDASLAELHRDFVKLGGGFEIIEERNSYRKQLIVKIPLADNYEEFEQRVKKTLQALGMNDSQSVAEVTKRLWEPPDFKFQDNDKEVPINLQSTRDSDGGLKDDVNAQTDTEADNLSVASTQTENPSEEVNTGTQTDLDDQRSEVFTQTENAKNFATSATQTDINHSEASVGTDDEKDVRKAGQMVQDDGLSVRSNAEFIGLSGSLAGQNKLKDLNSVEPPFYIDRKIQRASSVDARSESELEKVRLNLTDNITKLDLDKSLKSLMQSLEKPFIEGLLLNIQLGESGNLEILKEDLKKFIDVNKALIRDPNLDFKDIEDAPDYGIMGDLSGLKKFCDYILPHDIKSDEAEEELDWDASLDDFDNPGVGPISKQQRSMVSDLMDCIKDIEQKVSEIKNYRDFFYSEESVDLEFDLLGENVDLNDDHRGNISAFDEFDEKSNTLESSDGLNDSGIADLDSSDDTLFLESDEEYPASCVSDLEDLSEYESDRDDVYNYVQDEKGLLDKKSIVADDLEGVTDFDCDYTRSDQLNSLLNKNVKDDLGMVLFDEDYKQYIKDGIPEEVRQSMEAAIKDTLESREQCEQQEKKANKKDAQNYLRDWCKSAPSDQKNRYKQDDLGDIGKNLRECGLRDSENQPDEKAENLIISTRLIAR